MARYAIKMTSKKDGSVTYYKKTVPHTKVIDGIKMSYFDFELVGEIEKAESFFDEEYASRFIYKMADMQPAWMNNFVIQVVRIPTRRETVALNMTPLSTMVKLVKAYNLANVKGKASIRKKLFNNELVEECMESIKQINLLK